jgi:hypothetical protein
MITLNQLLTNIKSKDIDFSQDNSRVKYLVLNVGDSYTFKILPMLWDNNGQIELYHDNYLTETKIWIDSANQAVNGYWKLTADQLQALRPILEAQKIRVIKKITLLIYNFTNQCFNLLELPIGTVKSLQEMLKNSDINIFDTMSQFDIKLTVVKNQAGIKNYNFAVLPKSNSQIPTNFSQLLTGFKPPVLTEKKNIAILMDYVGHQLDMTEPTELTINMADDFNSVDF